jgi:predicted nucleotidyltransferase
VAAEFHPQRVVLLGSYAFGKPTPDSDVDLLVVMPHEGPAARQAARIRNRGHAGLPVDLLVRRPETVRRRLAMGDCFIEDILDQGKTQYEGSRARVG